MVKQRDPNIITIFGGPNFPTVTDEMYDFLTKHSNIDFYIELEGELGFESLLKKLTKYNIKIFAEIVDFKIVYKSPTTRYIANQSTPPRCQIFFSQLEGTPPLQFGAFTEGVHPLTDIFFLTHEGGTPLNFQTSKSASFPQRPPGGVGSSYSVVTGPRDVLWMCRNGFWKIYFFVEKYPTTKI